MQHSDTTDMGFRIHLQIGPSDLPGCNGILPRNTYKQGWSGPTQMLLVSVKDKDRQKETSTDEIINNNKAFTTFGSNDKSTTVGGNLDTLPQTSHIYSHKGVSTLSTRRNRGLGLISDAHPWATGQHIQIQTKDNKNTALQYKKRTIKTLHYNTNKGQ